MTTATSLTGHFKFPLWNNNSYHHPTAPEYLCKSLGTAKESALCKFYKGK